MSELQPGSRVFKETEEGLGLIKQNLETNLREAKRYWFEVNYLASNLEHISSCLGNPKVHSIINDARSSVNEARRNYVVVAQDLAACGILQQEKQMEQQGNKWILVKQELRELKTFMDQLQDVELIEEEAMELEDVTTFERLSSILSLDKQLAEIDHLTEMISQRMSSLAWQETAGSMKNLRTARLNYLKDWLEVQSKHRTGRTWLTQDLATYLSDTCSSLLAKEQRRQSLKKAIGPGGSLHTSRDSLGHDSEPESDDGLEDEQYIRLRSTLAKAKFCHLENERHKKEVTSCKAWIKENSLKLSSLSASHLTSLVMRGEMAVSSTEHSLADIMTSLATVGEKNISRDLEETRVRKRDIMKELLREISNEAVQSLLSSPFFVR